MEDSQIWTEKYRPKTFEEVKGQKKIVKRVKAFVEKKNLPHLLFAGPAGVGKSSLGIVAARQLFGEEWRNNFLELNASNDRGIDIVRGSIKDFARTKAIGNVPFKIIFLDECDSLTKEAQQALRRTMENYSGSCRFILSCVTPDTKIILPYEREINIENFADQFEKNPKHIRVQNISKKDKMKDDLVLAVVKLPASSIGKKILEITTMSRRKIKVTGDHKLLTTSGWKQANELSKEDKLLIRPNLESTPVEDNPEKIIKLKDFIKFLSDTEKKDGLKTLENSSRFRELCSEEKEKIIKRIMELRDEINLNQGLTEREFEVYDLIKKNKKIIRKELQENMGLTRMGMNYLLPSLVRKGYIQRIVNKKEHSFIICGSKPRILRNDMHIRHIIEKEFNIKMSYSAVKKTREMIARGRIDRVLGELTRKNLLNLTYDDIEKVGALSRICGFMMGDGHIGHSDILLHFSGNESALKEVQKDLEILGYQNYSKIKSVTLKNSIRGRSFVGTSTSFVLYSRALSLLLQYLGISKGDKTITPYLVPKLIKNGTKFVKREFIRGLFGCDADRPQYKNKNFGALSLRQNKSKFLKEEMLQYYKEISDILRCFDVTSYVTINDKGEIRRRDKIPVLTFNLTITPTNFNLQKYFSRVGYAYEKYKDKLARISSEYLRHKLSLIELWKKKGKLAIVSVNEGIGIRETARRLDITPDFVSNQLKGKGVGLPGKRFLSVDDWINKYKFNDNLIINDIVKIKEIDEDIVMDITCYKDHNFISNGFISHNCNFSSKVIDPIQSRCTVFRFKPLKEEEVYEMITKICSTEKISVDEKAKKALYDVSDGDLRRVVNVMQSCAVLSKNINEDLIYEVVSAAKPKEVKEVLGLAIKGDFVKARDLLISTMLKHGLSGLDIVKQIQKEIISLEVDDNKKIEMIEKCGEMEFRMVEGSDEFVQLEALIASFCRK